MPKIEPESAPSGSGSRYPSPFDEACCGRSWLRLGDAAGLTRFGVNLVRLAPGAWSSQRHWHSHEDELVYVLSGELVLVTDDGEQTLHAGDSAGFKAGVRNGHRLQNRSAAVAEFLAIGNRDDADQVEYPDIDLVLRADRDGGGFAHKDGTPY